MTEPNPYDLAAEAAEKLAELTGVERHDVALVLGSGWLPAVEALGEATAEIDTTDLPGFSAAAVAGHSGKIRSVRAGDRQLLVFLSRTHYYEGKGVAAVVHGVRTAGARRLPHHRAHQRLRRAEGDVDAGHAGADLATTSTSPAAAPSWARTSSTSPTSTARGCARCAARSTPTLDEGVYVQFPGPHYETPAEIRMAGPSAATWSA